MLIVDRIVTLLVREGFQQGFNLTLEMLIVDRQRKSHIPVIGFMSFNLTLEMLIVDRQTKRLHMPHFYPKFQSHT